MSDKKVVLIGAGKIGRGMSTFIFRNAGYHITYFCHSLKQAQAMREQGYFTNFRLKPEGGIEEIRIDGYDAYSTVEEYDKCVEILASHELAMVQLYPKAFDSIGELIAHTVSYRVRNTITTPLDIILAVNTNHSDSQVYEKTLKYITTPEEKEHLDSLIGLVSAIPSTLGAVPTPEMLEKDPLANYCGTMAKPLQLNADAFKGEIPDDIWIKPLHGIDDIMTYKLFTANLRQCGFGYLCYHKGYDDTILAAEDMEVQQGALAAVDEAEYGFYHTSKMTPEEVADAFGSTPEEEHDRLRVRMKNHDSITRICRDPIRKLARDERFTGPAIACMKSGKIPFFITRILSIVFDYDDPADPSSAELQQYISENGIYKAVEKYCSLDLADEAEKKVHELVLSHYHLHHKTDPDDMKI